MGSNYLLIVAAIALTLVLFAKWLLRDRVKNTGHPRTASPGAGDSEGSLKARQLRKDNLSKEVELDWEASELIELMPGAYAYPSDAGDAPGEMRPDEMRPGKPAQDEVRPGEKATEEYSLPLRYNKDRLVLLARDPRWIHAYWEVTRGKHQEFLEKHRSSWPVSRPVLRFYDLTESTPSKVQFDVYLNDQANNWYVRVDRPGHRFLAELGRMLPEAFVGLLRSNEVSLPPEEASSEIALEWAPPLWDSLYGRYLKEEKRTSPSSWGK